MLSNAYFLAKFRFDTAENEPAKNLKNFANNYFPNFANPNTEPPRPDLRHLLHLRGVDLVEADDAELLEEVLHDGRLRADADEAHERDVLHLRWI